MASPSSESRRPQVFRGAVCRLCGSQALEKVVSLAASPPANAFLRKEVLTDPEPLFPLDLALCLRCGHVQLFDVVNPELLFNDYPYVSGTAASFVEHFRRTAIDIVSRFRPRAGSLVVDIGSNDGTLLRFFKSMGFRTLGVDPAESVAALAAQNGIETEVAFFSLDCAHRLVESHGRASVLTANNVFAHVDDLGHFMDGVRALMEPGGVFVFQTQYLADLLEKNLFDMIYHEHLSYHSVTPLRAFFARAGFMLVEVRALPTHGGSIQGVAMRSSDSPRVDPSVDRFEAREKAARIHATETFAAFSERIRAIRSELHEALEKLKAQRKSIAGFGAPAKSTTLAHELGLGAETIEFIVDDNPRKQGLFTPGKHIPVLEPSAIETQRPDALFLFAWNFVDEILTRFRSFSEAGGRFIIPLPEVVVTPAMQDRP